MKTWYLRYTGKYYNPGVFHSDQSDNVLMENYLFRKKNMLAGGKPSSSGR
jgi:hypothetical protein